MVLYRTFINRNQMSLIVTAVSEELPQGSALRFSQDTKKIKDRRVKEDKKDSIFTMDSSHERQPSEECDWEKVSPVALSVRLVITDIQKSSSDSSVEIYFTVPEDTILPDGVAILVPASVVDEGCDLSQFPIGRICSDKPAFLFQKEDLASLNQKTGIKAIVYANGAILASSDPFSIPTDEKVDVISNSRMMTSIDDWNDGIVICHEEQKILDALNNEVSASRDRIAELELDIDGRKIKEASLESRCQESENAARESSRKIAEMQSAMIDVNNQKVAYQEELRSIKAQFEDIGKQIEEERAQKRDLAAQDSASQARIEGLKKLVAEERDQVKKLTEDNSALSARVEELVNVSNQYTNELITTKSELDNLHIVISETEEDKSFQQQLLAQIEAKFEDSEAEVGNLRKQVEERDGKILELMNVNTQMSGAVERASAQNIEESAVMKAELQSLQRDVTEKAREIQNLNQLVASLRAQLEEVSKKFKSHFDESAKAQQMLKQACTSMSQKIKVYQDEKAALVGNQKSIVDENEELKTKVNMVAKRLLDVSIECEKAKRENAEMSKMCLATEKELREGTETIQELEDRINQRDDQLGRRIQEADAAKANLDRGLHFWSEFKRQVENVVSVLLTEKDSIARMKLDTSEVGKKSQRCLDLCYRSIRQVKDELDDFEPQLKLEAAPVVPQYLLKVNSDVSAMSRDDLLLVVGDLKARIREAYKDFSQLTKECKELRKQEGAGKAALPAIKKSEGDFEKWLKNVADGGNDAIFAGTLDCKTATGAKQCILPTFFKGACGELKSAGFAIEDLAKASCSNCPSKTKDMEIWLKPAAKGANLSRTNFVDVSNSFSYTPASQRGAATSVAIDPDEDMEEFHDPCEFVPQPKAVPSNNTATSSQIRVPLAAPPKSYSCKYCTSIFESYQEEAYIEHLELHNMYGKNDTEEDDPFGFLA